MPVTKPSKQDQIPQLNPDYNKTVNIMADPEHEEYLETCEWLGFEYDPRHWDMQEVNRRYLARIAPALILAESR